jgi:two-component system OmpR family sensor kinase
VTLRARLILTVTLVVVVVITLLGVVAIRSTRRVLIDQIEDRIRTASRADVFPALGREQSPVGRALAVVILDPAGNVTRSLPSGLPGRLDPLPDTSGLDQPARRSGRMLTLPAVSGNTSYRALAVRAADGRTFVIAHTLEDVARAQAALTRRLLIGGGLVLLLGLGGVSLTVSRGLRPVNDMIETAVTIAAGDLTQRVPAADPGSELGRLGASLNEMLASIEDAFAAESRATSRLRQFVADASHELRTPLAAISGYVELEQTGALADDSERRRAMDRIAAEAGRMGRLVDDLALLARLDLADEEGAPPPLDLGPVNLAEVVRDAVADHAAINPSRPVSISGPAPLMVRGDPEHLTQVVANLLTNLRGHTPDGTSASIVLSRSEGWARLEYSDQGPGFPADSLAQVFDRFYRAQPSRSRRQGGTGLGLAIVAAIVEAHGGTVAATNLQPGGAGISVSLPAPG